MDAGLPRSYSQHGEDVFIHRLLRPADPPWVVDVGANDGLSWSNSRFFGLREHQLLLVEPMPDYAARCRALYAGDEARVRVEQVAVADRSGREVFYVNQDAARDLLAMRSSLDRGTVPSDNVRELTVQVVPLSSLLERHDWPAEYAMLSVDAEGFDLQVLRSAGLDRWRPRVVCVEDEVLGTSCADFLSGLGYAAHARLGPNGVYLRSA